MAKDKVVNGYKIDKQMAHKPESIGVTREEIQSRLPRGTSYKVTDSIVELVNNLGSATDLDQGMMEEQFLQSLHVLDG